MILQLRIARTGLQGCPEEGALDMAIRRRLEIGAKRKTIRNEERPPRLREDTAVNARMRAGLRGTLNNVYHTRVEEKHHYHCPCRRKQPHCVYVILEYRQRLKIIQLLSKLNFSSPPSFNRSDTSPTNFDPQRLSNDRDYTRLTRRPLLFVKKAMTT